MSDSNRGYRLTVVEGLLCFLAVLVAATAIFGVGEVFGLKSGREETSTRDYYETTKHRLLAQCVGQEGNASRECITEAIERSQEQSDSREDLYAQRDMARWAAWMAYLTGASVVVTLLGVVFVKRTLDATVKAVDETSKATTAMDDANTIAQQAQRAWLQIDVHDAKISAEQILPNMVFVRCSTWLTITNLGRSPALGIERREVIHPREDQRARNDFFERCRNPGWHSMAAIPPGGVEKMHLFMAIQLTPESFANLSPMFSLCVSLGYDDGVTNCRRHTAQSYTLCRKVSFNGGVSPFTHDELVADHPFDENDWTMGVACALKRDSEGILT